MAACGRHMVKTRQGLNLALAVAAVELSALTLASCSSGSSDTLAGGQAASPGSGGAVGGVSSGGGSQSANGGAVSGGTTGASAASGGDSGLGGSQAAFGGSPAAGAPSAGGTSGGGAVGGSAGVGGASAGAGGAGAGAAGTGSGSPSSGAIDWTNPVAGSPPVTGATATATVMVNRATTVGHVGQGFAGLSLEKTHLANGSLTGQNAPMIALFKLLGPSVIRFGGDDVDHETWDPAAASGGGSAPFPTKIGTADVDALSDFLSATGWKTIYGVNFKSSTAANSAAEAKYVATKLGAHLYGFEVGNEINFSGAWTAVRPKWESFAAAVTAAAPGSALIGPAAAGSGLNTVTVPFAADEASKIILLTQHYYRAQAGTGGATAASLMNIDPTLVSWLKTLSTAATANHIKDGFRMGECNTFSQHGQEGVSNALASALWSIDFLFTNAINGGSGVNLHGGQLGMDASIPTLPFYYAPIQETDGRVTSAAPLFYGMLLFSLAGTGDVVQTTAMAGGVNLSAYTIAQADGTTSVVLNNKDTTQGVTATVDLGTPVTAAAAIYLQGPTPVSLAATTGVTIAGASIAQTGEWAAQAPYALTATGNTVKVVIPPASIALVHAH